MGTRADFYVGRGEGAEWIGSIAWDGYPDGISKAVLKADSEKSFRAAVQHFFSDRDDVTLPEHGWPWPWDDSHTTDYAYAIDNGKVHAANFGERWFDPLSITDEPCIFPNMSDQKKVTLGERSGVMVFGS